jgi:hypothetical protein
VDTMMSVEVPVVSTRRSMSIEMPGSHGRRSMTVDGPFNPARRSMSIEMPSSKRVSRSSLTLKRANEQWYIFSLTLKGPSWDRL